ncbi:Uncharacterized protein Adt_18021 [Abeliophyllum distichum]|uniref:Uncharacterized protein n=1 Tax=Abeliophyllum distichum TaxID=126358 RepID=A0ABD1TI61_9LAMI
MTDDLNVWNFDSEYEDEIGDGWSTFISKKEKYQRSNEAEKLCISNSSKQNITHTKGVEDPKQTFKGHYNPQVKKLFENAEFGKGELRKLGDIDAVLLGRRVLSDSDGSFIAQPKYGFGYNPSPPTKIKVKKVSSNPIMI